MSYEQIILVSKESLDKIKTVLNVLIEKKPESLTLMDMFRFDAKQKQPKTGI